MTKIADMTIIAFLDALAARQSIPAGGGAAALTGSQAAALLSMVIRFTLDNKKYASVAEEMEVYLGQSEQLRQELLRLADRDVEAFNAVVACYAMPRATDEEKAARMAALQSTLQGATRAPLAIAEKCLAVLQLAAPVSAKGNSNVVSDAATAIYLIAAALHSSLLNVTINLRLIRDANFVAEWSARRNALLAAAHAAHGAAKAACEQTLGVAL
jgi:formiminotetrahydrofolate cyclodeaminase